MPKFPKKLKFIAHFLFAVVLVFGIAKFTVLNSTARTVHSAADTTPPASTYTQTPSSPNGNNDWFVSPVQFEIESTDLESGVKEILYRKDSGAWQSVKFTNSLNLAPNPSFETPGITTSGLENWEATVVDGQGTYSQDTINYAPSFASASAKITATGGTWHGINHRNRFAVATQYENMAASAWVKTENVTGQVYYTIYALADDGSGGEIMQQVSQSSAVTGTTGWTKLSTTFIVNLTDAKGVYMDIGLSGSGTVNIDAITINSSTKDAQVDILFTTDNENHRLEFYAVDFAGNAETYSCVAPIKNCIDFKLDQTTPGNWHDSGSFRGVSGAEHEVYVYTNVMDTTSGLSGATDIYQYHTEYEPTFGIYENLLGCNSNWLSGQWADLNSPAFSPGDSDVFLLTQKTDFCNSNWKVCKTVRFYAEDMAGNSTTKDFCINGPWIRFRNEGTITSNTYIDMLAEPEGDNTDALVEIVGNIINFFTSSQDWEIRNAPQGTYYDYDTLWNMTDSKIEITGQDLRAESGLFYINGDYEILNSAIPNDYDDATFNQIVFIDGNLTITNDVVIDETSTALFVVSGDVGIAKNADNVRIGIFTDGVFDTAYNVQEGDSTQTIELYGIYSADTFKFSRTLQGTNNDTIPSEDFYYEPKYMVQLRDYFGTYFVDWVSID